MPPPPRLFEDLFRSARIDELLSDRARLEAMLAFETALARAEAEAGIVPVQCAEAIARCCRPQELDLQAIAGAAGESGNPMVPLIRALRKRLAAHHPQAAAYLHFGATSQDLVDSSLVLCLRPALERLEAELAGVMEELARLAAAHRATPALARTLLQPAAPTSFGCRMAGFLDALLRHRRRLRELRPRLLVLQFGGAAGTLAALGEAAPAVTARLASELGLALPDMPWHAQRDRIVELGCWLAGLAGTLGKLARDVSLLAQAEVDELREPARPGRGASSAMPHKRNPVLCLRILTISGRTPQLAATLLAAMPQEQERGLGGWQAEWQALPDLCGLVGGALETARELLSGLEVRSVAMRANLDATQGRVFAEAVKLALLPALGAGAQERLERASALASGQGRHLRELLAEDPEIAPLLDDPEWRALFDPDRHLGSAPAFVDAVLDRYRRRTEEEEPS